MIYNRKIKLQTNPQEESYLDSQSKKCNWLYNQLLDLVKEDYKNGNANKYLQGRNVRDLGTSLKKSHPFLKTVHSSPLKNVGLRLKEAFSRVYKQGNGAPKFRSWKEKWFSLLYDEPKKGFKLTEDFKLELVFGKRSIKEKGQKVQLGLTVTLSEPLILEGEKIKTLRITKDRHEYFAIFTLEKVISKPLKPQKTWIVCDPNHKNLMVGINQDGLTYEFGNIYAIKYWDKIIDELKSKRDKCKKKAKFIKKEHATGKGHFEPSKRYNKLDRALNRAYHAKREQQKQALYAVSHYLAKRYDTVYVGDYTPNKGTAPFNNMHRSMLNQTVISKMRHTIFWVQQKARKHYKEVNEHNTTKDCCICGHQEKKDPSIRQFTCKNCGTTLSRDCNSSVNLAKKEGLAPKTLLYTKKPKHFVFWHQLSSQIVTI